MKQLITILFCLFTLFAEAQVNPNDTNKYFKSYDYGFSYRRLQAREAFIMPTDTVINKLGAVSLNGAIYLGNGIKWTSIGGGSTIDTTNQFVKRLTRTPGKDSIIYFVGANRFAIKDSVGSSTDTTSLSNRINLKVDSIRRVSDSVFAWINGVKFFQFKDSVGGGIGGSGTQYFVPKWSASTTLQNSQIFDSVNVGINTTTPAYKLDVNGTGRFTNDLYADEDFIVNNYFAINTTATDFPIPDGTLGIWRRKGNGFGTKFLEDEQGGAKDKWAFVKRQGYDQTRAWFQTNSSIVNINYGWGNPNQSNLVGNTLLIDPTIRIGDLTNTGTKIRGIYYNPTLDSLVNTTHIAFESTSGNVVMKGLKTSSSTTDSIAIWINDTLSKAPYPSGGGGATDTTSLSNRINLKLNISDTTSLSNRINLKQNSALTSYSFIANNTNATANGTAQQFRDTSGTYNGTITWTGTTAPSGATNHSYRLTQVGKCVTLHIALVFATNGAGLTAVQMTLPTGAPTPVQPTGLTGTINNLYPMSVQLSTTTSVMANVIARNALRNNNSANGFELFSTFGSTGIAQCNVTVQYWTN